MKNKGALVRTKLLVVLALSAVVGYSVQGLAQKSDNELGFKQYKLGAEESTIDWEGIVCYERPSETFDEICQSRSAPPVSTIAGAEVSGLSIFILEKKLSTIVVEFDRDSYSSVVAAMVQKYGPAKKSKATYTNAYGAIFTGSQANWILPGGAILIEEEVQSKPSKATYIWSGVDAIARKRARSKAAEGKSDL